MANTRHKPEAGVLSEGTTPSYLSTNVWMFGHIRFEYFAQAERTS